MANAHATAISVAGRAGTGRKRQRRSLLPVRPDPADSGAAARADDSCRS